jgi:hypothetical protein
MRVFDVDVNTASPLFVVVDVETSCYKNDAGDWESMPHFVGPGGCRPQVILAGIMQTSGVPRIHSAAELKAFSGPLNLNISGRLAVGHNFGFDFQHLTELCGGCRLTALWDTMIAAYVMSGQRDKFASLGELMQVLLSRPPKSSLIADNLAKGIPPQDIPISTLVEYLKNDLTDTSDVFQVQWRLCSSKERALILVLSRAALVYANCSHNGLLLDTAEAVTRRDRCFDEVSRMMEGFKEVWTVGNPSQSLDIAAVDSKLMLSGVRSGQWAVTPTAMSSLFFNAPHALDMGSLPHPAAGARRVRRVVLSSPLHSVPCPIEPPKPVAGREVLSTADDVLKKLVAADVEPHKSLARMEQHRRTHHKLGKTYYQALLEQGARYGGRVHPRIHTTSTNTGRTSSSDPNIQNQPPVTREVFVAEKDATFVEWDFQQLEIWALAVVSRCPDLIAALVAGDDIHYLTGLRAGMWFGHDGMTKEKRTLVKRINFGLIYGGGAKTLSEQSGAPVALVKRIIKSFYDTFEGVKRYHEKLVPWVQHGVGGPPNDFFVSREVVTRLGTYGTLSDVLVTTKTGRKYLFTEDKPGAGVSVTRIKNYFIQGFGTGDFVQLVLAFLWGDVDQKWWRAVIHDAALMELKAEDIPALETRLEDARCVALAFMGTVWGIEAFDIPLRLTVETKSRWSPMKDEDPIEEAE